MQDNCRLLSPNNTRFKASWYMNIQNEVHRLLPREVRTNQDPYSCLEWITFKRSHWLSACKYCNTAQLSWLEVQSTHK